MIVLVAGTRPEIIKLAPVHRALRQQRMSPVWLYTDQQPDLAFETFEAFDMKPDVPLELARTTGTLHELSAQLTQHVGNALEALKPKMVVVQGDTLSAFVGAQQAFLQGFRTAHVEAGLRSYDVWSPYPEEACRVWIDAIADLKFAPTERAALNCNDGRVYVTGNTVVDALGMVRPGTPREGRYAVVTMHRRENADGVKGVIEAVKALAAYRVFDYIVWPVHPNPMVKDVVPDAMRRVRNVECCAPLGYPEMVNLVRHSQMLLTDSGGLQEEALALSIPCLVMRRETERPEGVAAGGARVVGTDAKRIVGWATWLMENEDDYLTMATAPNPYGDGKAGERIAYAIKAAVLNRDPDERKIVWQPPSVKA